MSIKRYMKNIQDLSLEIDCPCCDRRLGKHATYRRNLLFKQRTYRIPVQRMRCPACRQTFSLIPFFITPWMPFANHIREWRLLFAGFPLSRLPEKLSSIHVSMVSLRTLYRWKARLQQRWKTWYIAQRTAWACHAEEAGGLLPLYREGMNSEQEREMVFRFFLRSDQLPRRGTYLNRIHLHLAPTEFW